jgi:AGZA family xanthine/uracil permease-like MFS transporter
MIPEPPADDATPPSANDSSDTATPDNWLGTFLKSLPSQRQFGPSSEAASPDDPSYPTVEAAAETATANADRAEVEGTDHAAVKDSVASPEVIKTIDSEAAAAESDQLVDSVASELAEAEAISSPADEPSAAADGDLPAQLSDPVMDLVDVEPADVEPVGTEPTEVEPAEVEPVETDPVTALAEQLEAAQDSAPVPVAEPVADREEPALEQEPVLEGNAQNFGATSSPPQPVSLESVVNGGAIARFFDFEALGTNLRTETLAGVTTFITMAYILVVNPDILSQAIFVTESGDLFGQLVVATGLSAAIATLIMGVVAKYPIALAPGMGLNAFFAFSVVLGLGIDWRVALAAVLLEGLIFIALTLTNLRAQIIKAIPESLKRATAAGIGLFIAYIALAGNPEFGGAGIIIASATTKTTLGDLSQPPTLMALFGILVTSALIARRLKGALLWGILATALLGWILGITPWPEGIVGLPFWPGALLGQAFVGLGQIDTVGLANFLVILFVFLFVDLFDTIGTLSGIGIQSGFIGPSGELPRANQALLADAVGTTAGAVLGTSTVTSYIESASGIADGGRSGFTAVVTAMCFGLSLFFIPLLTAIPGYATAPALLMVGVLMMGSVAEIRWSDPAEAIPAF